MDDLLEYFTACFDRTQGWLIVATGRGPYLTDGGKYAHRQWSERAWRWPAQAERAMREIRCDAPHADVYICPYLMRDRHRAKGNAVSHVLVHTDVDGGLDLERVKELGGFAIASGTPGHGHVYVPLSYAVTAAQHELLCRGLAAQLGGDPGKISDNDLLRPPGTLNHKPTVGGADAVSAVTL